MTSPGRLIVFEGPDKVGKTSIAHQTVAALQASGIDCEYLAFPGRKEGTLGYLVYRLHHNPEEYQVNSINQTSLQIMHIAAHIDAIESYILPTLLTGKTIILDRFWWSTIVYGTVRGVPKKALRTMVDLELLYWKDRQPDMAFLIEREAPIDQATDTENWHRLMLEYNRFINKHKITHPLHPISNDGSFSETVSQVLCDLSALFNELDSGISPHTKIPTNSLSSQEFKPPMPTIIPKLLPAKPSIVYDRYWYLATERQNIFFNRAKGLQPPWTDDPILANYRFTNAYRASDRVSQYLIKNVIYKGDQTIEEMFFRIILYKIFNRIETWELLCKSLGEVRFETYSFATYDDVITRAMEKGVSVFSAAYIMPTGSAKQGFDHRKKHRNYLQLIERMIIDEVPARLAEMKRMRDAFELLRSYPLLGDFLAYQYVIDINYSPLTNFSENEFVVPGPGARSGIRKCFLSTGGLNDSDIIRLMVDRQEEDFERLGLNFQSLWGRSLHLIDCQNLFCEVDKYARIAHPDIKGIGDRVRIKQSYQSKVRSLEYWYPPDWGLNERTTNWLKDVRDESI